MWLPIKLVSLSVCLSEEWCIKLRMDCEEINHVDIVCTGKNWISYEGNLVKSLDLRSLRGIWHWVAFHKAFMFDSFCDDE